MLIFKKNGKKFANPKKLPTFAIPNRYAGKGKRGISSVGRAFEWHSKGQEFDSPMLHKKARHQAGLFLCSMLPITPRASRCPTPMAFFVYKPFQTVAKTGVPLDVWSGNLVSKPVFLYKRDLYKATHRLRLRCTQTRCTDTDIGYQEYCEILGIHSKNNVKFAEIYSNPLNLVIEAALISSTMSM